MIRRPENVAKIFVNLPWSVMMLFFGVLSLPNKLSLRHNALIVYVKNIWWVPRSSGVRAMTLGNVIVLGPHIESKDLAHELVHIEQAMRRPFIHPVLSFIESTRHKGLDNIYEREAYQKAGNNYYAKK